MDNGGKVILYDTTLRDGMAREGLNLSVKDKVRIARRLASFGIPYIEGGYAGSNPKEMEFFRHMAENPLTGESRLVAFGSTRRKEIAPADDEGIKALLAATTNTVCIFGKSSEYQARVALRTTPEENLLMISDTIGYLREQGREVLFDAEHFFDAFLADPAYAKKALAAAADAGASHLVLCDTNGGFLPSQIKAIVDELIGEGFKNLGIHTHNDAGCAVANSLVAVEAGCNLVQGTINGFGERTGNADLCCLIPAFELKMNRPCLPEGNLSQLTKVSHFVSEVANLRRDAHHPYVGKSAFAHKGGAHGAAVRHDPGTYEHIDPEKVGNIRKLVISEIAGRSMIKDRASALDLKFTPEQLTSLIDRIKEKEHAGYTYEAADASLDLMLLEDAGRMERFFELESYHVSLFRRSEVDGIMDATVKIRVGTERYLTAEEGNGPVNALDRALRKSLEPLFPKLKEIKLLDFKVRVLEGSDGTSAVTRVLIESGDGVDTWGTVGVNDNIIKACWDALYDSLEYGLYRFYGSGKKNGD